MNIYLMRHGETHWNIRGYFQGSTDIDLTDYGIELARITRDGFLKDGIRFDRVYSSPLLRAKRTAAVINQPQKAPVFIDDRIREMGFGAYEGRNVNELKKTDKNVRYCVEQPALYRPDPLGEEFQDVYDRVDDFMEHELAPLEQDPAMKNVLVVCHGAVLRCFLTRMNNIGLDRFWEVFQPNCCVNLAELKDGRFRSVKENMLYYKLDKERFKNRL